MDAPIDTEFPDIQAPEVLPVGDQGEVTPEVEIPEQPLTVESVKSEVDSKQADTVSSTGAAKAPENDSDLSPVTNGMLGLSQDGLATVRPRDRQDTIETLPNVEKDGTTIKIKTEVSEEPLEPPKDWKPGGPEKGM